MGKFRTVVSVILMVLAARIGFAVDAGLFGSGFGGTILFAMIAGFACVIYVLDNRER